MPRFGGAFFFFHPQTVIPGESERSDLGKAPHIARHFRNFPHSR
jgi:hypothetical protein